MSRKKYLTKLKRHALFTWRLYHLSPIYKQTTEHFAFDCFLNIDCIPVGLFGESLPFSSLFKYQEFDCNGIFKSRKSRKSRKWWKVRVKWRRTKLKRLPKFPRIMIIVSQVLNVLTAFSSKLANFKLILKILNRKLI